MRSPSMFLSLGVFLAAAAGPPAALAQAAADTAVVGSGAPPAAAAPAPPGLAQVLESSGITASGYVSASYYHSSGANSFHQFDINHDTFQLDQAGVTLAWQPKQGVGALVDVLAGEDARVLNLAEADPGHVTDTDPKHYSVFNIRQAYVQYVAGAVTLIGGKFTTLAGQEYSNPTSDANFSRSLLFFAEPLTHTGLRAVWTASDQVAFTGGVNNGWNTTSTSYGSKTAEVGLTVTPVKAVTLNLQGYFGKVPGFDAERSFVDFVGGWTVSDALTLALSADWGRQEQHIGPALSWKGVAGYTTYTVNSLWKVSARAEYLRDEGGFVTGTAQKIREGTLTLGYTPVKNLELRLEGRYDKSDQPTFVGATIATAAAPDYRDHQSEIALQALYRFGGS